ncbi:hemolysin family protein [Chloroflexota bacterium]
MEPIIYVYIVLSVIFLGLSSFFSSAETAFIGASRVRIKLLKYNGDITAAEDRVIRIMKNPERILSTVLLGNNLVNTAMAALGTLIAVSFMSDNVAAAVATIVVTFLLLIFGEATPKTIAAHHAERLAFLYVRPLEIMSVIFYPFVIALSWIASNLTRLAGERPASRLLLWSEKEIRTAISLGAEEGLVEKVEADMLNKVFEFGDRPALEVMTPRTDVNWIEQGTKLADFLSIYAQEPHTRYPIYEGNFDNVTGMVSIKDVLLSLAQNIVDMESPITKMTRPVHFVPETKQISELFSEMQTGGYQVAIIIDEYGGTAGVITLNQLVEEIMGELGDELARSEKEFETIDATTFQVDGNMRVEEVGEQLGVELPSGEYETVAGFVMSLLGRIPREGEQVKFDKLKIVITGMKGRKIEKILITKEASS